MRLTLALLALMPAVGNAQWHHPLDVRNHRSADLAFLRLTPRSHTASPGGRHTSISLIQANEFRVLGPADEDAETFRPLITHGIGLRDGTELFFEIPLIVRGGGFLDSIIEWWHDHVIQQHDPIRASTAKGRSHIEFPGGGPFGSAVGIGDITVGAARSLKPSLTGRLAAKLPTGNASQLLGSGGFDVGAALDWSKQIGDRWSVHINGALVLQGPATELSGTRRTVYSSAVTLTWEMNSRDAWTVQWSTEQSPTKTGDPSLDSDHRVLSFGYQRRLDGRMVLQLYFSENGDFLSFPGGPTVGPDLTIAARLIWID